MVIGNFNKLILSCATILCTVSLAACSSSATGSDSDNYKSDNETSSISFDIETKKDVQGQYQFEQAFPIEVTDEEYFDDSLLTNQMTTFLSYSDQGTILLKSENIANFKVFINGNEVKMDNANNSVWNSIDISEITINGNNKVQVSKVKGDSEDTLEVKIPYPTLIDATSEYKENDNFKFIDQIVNAEIKNGFTSAQLVITKNGKIIKQSAYGNINSYNQDGSPIEDGRPVTNDTLYDLASNTKMYATNYAIQKLVSEGNLNVDQKVREIFPSFRDKENDKIKGKDELTIKEILQHQAGFPADPQYHNNNYDSSADDLSTPNANKVYTQDRDEMLQMVIDTPLEYAPGTETKYSDVDYILLGFIVEKVSGKHLDEYMQENYYSPLGLKHVTFNPLENGFKKDEIAATELNGNTRDGIIDFRNIRKNTIQGEVHDEKAFYSMNGISGHAGLFSNASDLAVLTQITLNRGGYEENKFFDEDTMEEFIKPKDGDPSYGLGWRRKGSSQYSWAFSPIADSSTIGHTGWVGTLTVIDPVNNISIVLLTNTKNSPVLNKDENPNDFVGNHFLTGGYGLISTLSFDSIDNSNKNANDSKLVDIIVSKYDLIQAKEAYQTDSDKAALHALADVVNERKDGSSVVEGFLKSEKWKTIEEFLRK
ncbi:penicillin binding protein PBP4B [Carnobacterium mobile]|uniref:penicillin binding protein PBP4B n=1 Tax=Carnobacterium mobile TaxID=2750 RepID=UPI001866812F|nr:penicillin binding protein PBP4B [Carnobacterium mobile]